MNTQDELEREKKLKVMSMIINHNGNVAYQIFTGKPLERPIRITAISAPINGMPTAVGFVDPKLMEVMASNDMDNPDGSKAPEPLAAMTPPPPPKKRATLKVIK